MMAQAFTNEERFIASCKIAGEADVRQKLGAGRYSERRTQWATAWLEQLDLGKSDSTKAEEQGLRLLKSPASSAYARLLVPTILIIALFGCVLAYLTLS